MRKSANSGYLDAQYGLGCVLELNGGRSKDIKEAVAWYEKAASCGEISSQLRLSNLFESGKLVPKDPAKALAWLRAAAIQGNGEAELKLGMKYLTGDGVPEDSRHAYAWMSVGIKHGNIDDPLLKDVKRAFERLNASLEQWEKNSAIVPELDDPGTISEDRWQYHSPFNFSLPEHIQAPAGKLSLVADFANAGDKGVPLYLINRTSRSLTFRGGGWQNDAVLQYQEEDGTWTRAQGNNASWCGNSWRTLMVGPCQHIPFFGEMPLNGRKARVRFAYMSDPTIVSNEGDGWISPTDAAGAAEDSQGGGAPSSLFVELANAAHIFQTGLPSPQKCVQELRLLECYHDNAFWRYVAEQLTEQWEHSPDNIMQEATRAMREILAHPWPQKPDADALRQRCIDALKAGPTHSKSEFGMPEDDPGFVWSVLSELAADESYRLDDPYGRDPSVDLRHWKPVIDLLKTEVCPKPGSLAYAYVASILTHECIADELMYDKFFEEHFFDGDPDMVDVCARTLARRNQWDRLTELASRLPPEHQLTVLRVLALPGQRFYLTPERRDPESNEERLFWMHCFNTQPIESARQLGTFVDAHAPVDRALHEILRKRLEAEIERSAAAREDFAISSNPGQAIEALAGWNNSEDNPLFKKLLAYRGYSDSEFTDLNGKSHINRKYEVRSAAKKILMQRNQSVPTDIVVEKEVALK